MCAYCASRSAASEESPPVFPWTSTLLFAFFLFAATAIRSLQEQQHHLQKHNRNSTKLSLRQQEFESIREAVFQQVFLKLREEFSRFETKEGAIAMLNRKARRRPFCGGWTTDIPDLVLRSMGRRCPPMSLA